MRWIVGLSLKFRFIVVALTAFLMFFGVQQLDETAVDVFPEFAPPKVEIHTVAVGLAPTEVEELITVPLEQSFNAIPDVATIRSRSVEQLSQIVLLFDQGTDLLDARQLVAERIATVTPTLPSWAAPPVMLQPLSATSRVMKIGLSTTDPQLDLMDLSMTAYWKIRARLLRVPGVANVPIWGERLEMLQVQADPRRLAEQRVTLEQVMNTTADALDAGLVGYSPGHFIGRGGWIEDQTARLGIQHVQAIVTHDDLANLPVTSRDGRTVRLGDVADLVRDHQPLIGSAVINEGDGLMLIVEKLPWANTLDVTEGIEAALEELRPGLTGIAVDSAIFRPATFIEDAIGNLGRALILGALLMILMLGAFLYSWRTALISVVAIPVSLLSAMLVLNLYGVTVNTMVLAGFVIALGDVVDDAIIDIENVVRRLRQHRQQGGGGKSTARVILDASLEVRGAIVYATIIEIVAILPIFALAGLSGSFFRPLVLAYALALFASMVVALTVTPALSMIFFRNAKSLEHRDSPLVAPMKRGYERLLVKIMPRPRRAYAVVAVTTVAGIAVLPVLGQSLLPNFKERDFLMHWLTKPDTSLQEEVRTTKLVNAELLTIPGVRNAGSHIGNALLGDEPYGVYFGENWISVDRSVDYDDTADSIREVVDGYPGIYRDVLTYLRERIREVLTGTSDPITIRIFGQDLDLLREKAEEVDRLLADIPGVGEHYVDFQDTIPQLKVEVDLTAARQSGLKPGDVRRAAAWLMAGEEAGDLFVGGRAYDVQVWSPPENRQSVTDLTNLMIDTPGGGQVRLADVADVSIEPVPNVVHHEDLLRNIDVGASLDGSRDLGSVVRDVERSLEEVQWPLEFRAEMLGEYTERQSAQQRLLLFAVLAAAVIFLLLQAAFRSWRLATMAFVTLPIALVGGLLGAFVVGRVISLGSLVGFLTVFGIVARNGIMLISHCQHLEQSEGEPFGPQLVLRAATERLVPIMMTVLTTGFALIPLLVAGSIPGQEIEHPMAVVIFGGLITATLLNLFVVPSLYLRFAKSRWSPLPAA
jgi:CzcA family heavy metal efflux pump